jgi:hypothetical protein
MQQLFELWAQANKASQLAMDLEGRINYPTLGVVTNNNDPEGRRRVKVNTSLNPGLDSRWLTRLSCNPYRDATVPAIGQTVLVLFIDGLETNGCYLSIMNDTNPSYETDTPLDDLKEEIKGNREVEVSTNDKLTVNGTSNQRVEGSINIEGGSTITIQNDSGASITLGTGGQVILTDSLGRSLRLGGSLSNDNIWDLNNFPLKLQNVPSATINGNEIATVGAVDSDGDTLVTKGW